MLIAIVLAGVIAYLATVAFRQVAVENEDRAAYHEDMANRIITGAGNPRNK